VRYPLVELATGVVFAAIGWGLGPHWSVAGFCVVAATLVALVTIERDGQTPPSSVAVMGTTIATVLLLAAGTADRHWSRVAGVAIAVAGAGVLVLAIGRLVPIDAPGPATASPWPAATPALLPVGAALGWLGPPYVVEGLAATVVVWVSGRLAQRLRPGTHRGVLVLAFAVGVVVALATAVARSRVTGI
jgi:leader peptidase (prepilin peptidase)/N-methyltransferase